MASARPQLLLRRLALLLNGRICVSHRLLVSASPAAETPAAAPAEPEAVSMTDNCVRRLEELHARGPSAEGNMLRLSIEAGGCSGFQYTFSLDSKKNADDRVFQNDVVSLIVDNVSYDFMKGATMDYTEELIHSSFLVSTNPSVVGGCSCKSSFMVK